MLVFPLLYLMQAMPVHIVQDVAVLVYKDLGIPNNETVRWTSLIALPWSMQFLLGSLVDFNSTKRAWILGGQAIIAVGLIVAAFTLGLPNAFAVSLAVLFIMAISSALCNIATDGFFIFSQTKSQQTAMAGVQTTCYRLGRLFCTWLLVKVAGRLQTEGGWAPARAWTTVLVVAAVLYFVGHLVNRRQIPVIEPDQPKPETEPNQSRMNLLRTFSIVGSGLSIYFCLNSVVRLAAHGLWAALGADPAGKFKGWQLVPAMADGVAQPSRWGPIYSPFDPVMSEVVQFGVCFVAILVSMAFMRKLLRGSEMNNALGAFFRQAEILPILIFILFYRFPEAMIGKMTPLFYRDKLDVGGLGLTTENVGDIKGLFSVLGIILGGIIGGYVVHKLGLKRSFWIVATAMHVPNLLYLWAAFNHTHWAVLNPSNFSLLVFFEIIDQMGYGIGYAAYFVFLMQVAQRGNHVTTHYAIASGLGALCIALAGITGGILQQNFGWPGLFIGVAVLGIPALLTLLVVKVDAPATSTA